ncbi:hypothetical protein BDN72DRAFT_851394 [Pluteus cervinus]|uniref:Uncharacterized protein n=1 Tax=Pluteus cervinus TaxID=181527 RepID=A0ACD3A2W1_9AGAR|nr:hypothetical protein BDN72DRAFT_851394 [Pluteus cervinus]
MKEDHGSGSAVDRGGWATSDFDEPRIQLRAPSSELRMLGTLRWFRGVIRSIDIINQPSVSLVQSYVKHWGVGFSFPDITVELSNSTNCWIGFHTLLPFVLSPPCHVFTLCAHRATHHLIFFHCILLTFSIRILLSWMEFIRQR